jgi:hypothetical protein
MFIVLLASTFLIALAVSMIVVKVFNRPVAAILRRLIADEIYTAWARYLTFAIYVVGISSGVNIWNLEKYITEPDRNIKITPLTTNRWIFEIYRTIIGTLQGIAWLLLLFFIFALIAYVIIRVFEIRKNRPNERATNQE